MRDAVGAYMIIVVYVNLPVIENHEYFISQACSPVAYCVERQWRVVIMMDRIFSRLVSYSKKALGSLTKAASINQSSHPNTRFMYVLE